MEKCNKCGAELSDDCKFCPNCGSPIVHNSKCFCPNCGVEVQPDDVFCANCGAQISKSQNAESTDTPHSQTGSNDSKPSNSENKGVITVIWRGIYSVINISVEITVNGTSIGTFSFNNGYEVHIPITSPQMNIMIEHSGMKSKIDLSVNVSDNYVLDLYSYSSFSGSYKYSVTNSRTKETQSYRVKSGYFDLVMAGVFFPYGFYKYFSYKGKNQRRAKIYLIYALLGVAFWCYALS